MKGNLYIDEFLYKVSKRLNEAIGISIRNKNKLQTNIRRHGELDKDSVKLISYQSDFDADVSVFSKMIGNIIKYL